MKATIRDLTDDLAALNTAYDTEMQAWQWAVESGDEDGQARTFAAMVDIHKTRMALEADRKRPARR